MSEVKLPKAIREEAERAEQIERELAAMVNDQITDAVTQTQPIEVPPIDDKAVQSTEETPPEETPPEETPPQEDPNSETWQSRYNALQGKYNAEVPRLHQQVRELTQYAQQLEARANAAPSDHIEPTGRFYVVAWRCVGSGFKLLRVLSQLAHLLMQAGDFCVVLALKRVVSRLPSF